MSAPLGVVVVGASSGFGAALADDLAAAGHSVVAGARRPGPGSGRLYLPLDVTDSDAVAGFAAAAVERLDRLDGLVYCAADPGAVGRAWRVDPVEFARVLDVSVLGFLRCVTHLVPAFEQTHAGSILAVGSKAARVPIDLLAAYGSAKAALEHYTLCLATELAGTGIRANVIGIAGEAPLARTHRAAKEQLRGRSSVHPPLPPVSDSIPLARWLLSPDARHVTGQIIEARQP